MSSLKGSNFYQMKKKPEKLCRTRRPAGVVLQVLAILNTSSGVRTPPSCSCSTNLNADASDTVTRVLCYSIADRKDTELGIGHLGNHILISYNTWNLLPISFLSLTSLLFGPIQVPQLTWVGEHDYFGPGQVPQPTREMGKRTTLNPACLAKARLAKDCIKIFKVCKTSLQDLAYSSCKLWRS